MADDDLRVPGASPPPQPLLGRVVDGGPSSIADDDLLRVPGPLIADDDVRVPGDTPKPQPLLTWDATDGPPLPSVADDDMRVPGDTPKPRPLIDDDDLRVPGASGPPRPRWPTAAGPAATACRTDLSPSTLPTTTAA